MEEAFEESAGQWSGAATESVDGEYYNLLSGLEDIKVNLDECSKSLIKCHSSAASSNRHFIGLRSDLTRNANVYVDLNFLMAVQVVTNLQKFFMEYSVLNDFKQFKRHIKDIDKSISQQAKGAAVLSKVNCLLLSDLQKLQMHVDKKLKHIEDDARAQRKIASDALKDSIRLKEKCDAEKEEYENEKKRCETGKREYEAEKVRCDEMRKVHEAEKRTFDAEKQEHEAEKRRWDAKKDEHQLEKMKYEAEKMEHEAERMTCDLKKQEHDNERIKWEAEETKHAAVQRECDADKKECDERVEYLQVEKARAGNSITAGLVVGGLASAGAAALAAPAVGVIAAVGASAVALNGFTRRNYAQDQEQKATSKGLRAAKKGEEAKEKSEEAAEQGSIAAENARTAAEKGQRAAEKGRSAAREGEIAAMNGRRAAEKEEIAKANGRAAAEAAAITAEQGRRAAENEQRAREMAEDAAKKAHSAAVKARRATARGEDLIAEGERVAEDATKEAVECSKAVKLIKEDLIESLNRFIKALDKITGFMAVLAKDTNMYAGKISDGRQMKMHLESIKKFESKIVKSVDAFVMFHTTVQARCSGIRNLDQGLDAPPDEPGVNDVNGWCLKHKASGGLQQHELAIIQLHLGSESVGNLVNIKRANLLHKLLTTMSTKKRILNS